MPWEIEAPITSYFPRLNTRKREENVRAGSSQLVNRKRPSKTSASGPVKKAKVVENEKRRERKETCTAAGHSHSLPLSSTPDVFDSLFSNSLDRSEPSLINQTNARQSYRSSLNDPVFLPATPSSVGVHGEASQHRSSYLPTPVTSKRPESTKTYSLSLNDNDHDSATNNLGDDLSLRTPSITSSLLDAATDGEDGLKHKQRSLAENYPSIPSSQPNDLHIGTLSLPSINTPHLRNTGDRNLLTDTVPSTQIGEGSRCEGLFKANRYLLFNEEGEHISPSDIIPSSQSQEVEIQNFDVGSSQISPGIDISTIIPRWNISPPSAELRDPHAQNEAEDECVALDGCGISGECQPQPDSLADLGHEGTDLKELEESLPDAVKDFRTVFDDDPQSYSESLYLA